MTFNKVMTFNVSRDGEQTFAFDSKFEFFVLIYVHVVHTMSVCTMCTMCLCMYLIMTIIKTRKYSVDSNSKRKTITCQFFFTLSARMLACIRCVCVCERVHIHATRTHVGTCSRQEPLCHYLILWWSSPEFSSSSCPTHPPLWSRSGRGFPRWCWAPTPQSWRHWCPWLEFLAWQRLTLQPDRWPARTKGVLIKSTWSLLRYWYSKIVHTHAVQLDMWIQACILGDKKKTQVLVSWSSTVK